MLQCIKGTLSVSACIVLGLLRRIMLDYLSGMCGYCAGPLDNDDAVALVTHRWQRPTEHTIRDERSRSDVASTRLLHDRASHHAHAFPVVAPDFIKDGVEHSSRTATIAIAGRRTATANI